MAYKLFFEDTGFSEWVSLTSSIDLSGNFTLTVELDVPIGNNFYTVIGRASDTTSFIRFDNNQGINTKILARLGSSTVYAIDLGRNLRGERVSAIISFNNGAFSAEIDGVVSSLSAANSGLLVNAIHRYDEGNSGAGWALYGLTINADHNYDPSASSGTGSTLIDTVGGNNGTLIGFPTDDSQWVSYGAPAVPTLSTPTATAVTSNSISFSIPVTF